MKTLPCPILFSLLILSYGRAHTFTAQQPGYFGGLWKLNPTNKGKDGLQSALLMGNLVMNTFCHREIDRPKENTHVAYWLTIKHLKSVYTLLYNLTRGAAVFAQGGAIHFNRGSRWKAKGDFILMNTEKVLIRV